MRHTRRGKAKYLVLICEFIILEHLGHVVKLYDFAFLALKEDQLHADLKVQVATLCRLKSE